MTSIALLSFITRGLTIVNGSLVEAHDPIAASTVAIYSQGQGVCSGSIVAEDLVLTAAHCVHTPPMRIVFSTNAFDTASQTITVDRYESHPDWAGPSSDMENMKNMADLALLHFEGGLPSTYAPVTIANSAAGLRDGGEVTLAGYGSDEVSGNGGKGVLRKTRTHVLELDFTSGEMRIDQSRGTGACFGDSGGPALIDTPLGYRLVGVTHGGPSCDTYSVYTKPYAHLDWIRAASARLTGSTTN